jgi:hypothetical protein
VLAFLSSTQRGGVYAAVYRRRAFDYIEAHKRRLPLVVAARIGRTWSLYRPLDMVSFNKGEGREPWVTRLGLVAYYPTLIAAVSDASQPRDRARTVGVYRFWRDFGFVLGIWAKSFEQLNFVPMLVVTPLTWIFSPEPSAPVNVPLTV